MNLHPLLRRSVLTPSLLLLLMVAGWDTASARAETEETGSHTHRLIGEEAHESVAQKASLPTVAGASNHAPGVVESEATNQTVGSSHPALLDSRQLFSSSNLLAAPKTVGPPPPNFQILLDQALQAKQANATNEAEKLFVRLLKSAAPVEMQKTALLELAVFAQEKLELARAQQIYAQYLNQFHDDPIAPELLLRQGLLFRQMGAPVLALSKFYAVMSSALHLKQDRLDYYQRIVVHAQSEIAETYYLQGKHDDAADYFIRLLKLDSPDLDKAKILFKLVRSLAARDRHNETITQATLFLNRYPDAEASAEVHFLLAQAFKKLGRNREALEQVMSLLESQKKSAERTPQSWVYWRQRTGNGIANQLYQEGDYPSALQIYLTLSTLSNDPEWQLPALYQVGLVYERLRQPEQAATAYERMLQLRPTSSTNALSPTLTSLLDMANWRKGFLGWQQRADASNQQLKTTPKNAPASHE